MKPVVAGFFQVLEEDLAAARHMAGVLPRISAYHLQQAAEKLVKAILAAEGIHPGPEHNIGQLLARLPPGHEWRADLVDLDALSRFATAYRYPSEAGRVAAPPDRAFLERHAALIESLAGDARTWCAGKE
ncbi:HEPN domain-containing protein [Novispirillum sp. DQ9]|uniref:HEPN domain-containing protein n=1 Tax=Novispirillum sp. DQ9 TaxID=3398612 RepID=UPI003C7D6D2B